MADGKIDIDPLPVGRPLYKAGSEQRARFGGDHTIPHIHPNSARRGREGALQRSEPPQYLPAAKATHRDAHAAFARYQASV